jgi:hypothetical protein
MNLFSYDSSGEVEDAVVDSAFAVIQLEEDKGLGRALFIEDEYGFADLTRPCTPEDEANKLCVPFDEGKNQWYHTFSMSLTDGPFAKPQDGLLTQPRFPRQHAEPAGGELDHRRVLPAGGHRDPARLG